jgi:hypothetical protein
MQGKTETHRRGSRIGVSRDGKALGHAVRVPRSNPESWTAFVNIEAPPFDACRTGFASADDAAAFIAQNGYAR